MLILLAFSLFFLNVVFDKSYLFHRRSDALKEVSSYLEGSYKGGRVLVISNVYFHFRSYLDLSKFIVVPPPIYENEFLKMLEILPDGSFLIITNDPVMSWYEYANSYIKKYVSRNIIIRLCSGSSEGCIEVKKVHEVKRDGYVTAIFVKEGYSSPQSIPVKHGSWLHLVNVAFTGNTCILNLEGNINYTKVILATVRFSKLIDIPPGKMIISDSSKDVKEAVYVCLYSIAITLDSLDSLWIHMYIKLNYFECTFHISTLLFMLIFPFIVSNVRSSARTRV